VNSATAGRTLAGLLAAVLLLAAVARAGDPPSPAAAPHSARRIVVDGNLDGDEWDTSRTIEMADGALDPRPGASAAWKGPADASARLLVCWDDERLYFGGRVHDDDPVVVPGTPFMGDCVEVFLRIPEARGAADTQWILAPLAQEVRWLLARHRGRPGKTDGGLDGVEVAGREVRDEKGAFLGYTFEAALPFSNFPGFDPTGASVGLNLALVDADGGPGQKTYLLWHGRTLPAYDPSALGTLRFEGSRTPPAAPADRGPGTGLLETSKVPAAILLGTLLLLALLWRLRRPLQRLGDLPLGRKVAIAAVLALLVVGVRAVPDFARGRREDRAVERLEEGRAMLLRLAGEAAEARVLAPRRSPDSDSPLVSLLEGKRVLPPPDYRFLPLPAVPRAPRRTLGTGTPVRDGEVRLAGIGQASFRLGEPVDADALTVVLSWTPPAPGRPQPPPGTAVGTVTARCADGTAALLEVRLGREVDDERAARGDAHDASEAKVAWTEAGAEGSAPVHADEVHWRLPGAPRRVDRIAVEASSPDGSLVLRGLTIHRSGGGEALPVALGRSTADGVLSSSWNGGPAAETLRLGPGAPRGVVPVDAAGDAVFVVYGAPEGFPPVKAGRPALSLQLVLEDGTRPPAVTLVHGVHLDPARLAGLGHPADFAGTLAWKWTGPGGETLHRDLVALPVEAPPGVKVLALEAELLDPETAVALDGVTVARRLARPPPSDLHAIHRRGDGYERSPAAADALEGLFVTHYRGGRAAATTLPADLRDRVLGTEEPPALLPRGASDLPEGVYGRTVGGRPLLALQGRLPFRDGDEMVELAVPAPDAVDLEVPVAAATVLLLLLAIPLLLASALDTLERLPRLRWKLVGAFAVAAVIPLVGLTLVLARHFETQVDRGVERELRAHADAAARALTARREEARRLAEEMIRDDALLRALAIPEEEARTAALDQAVRGLAAREPGVRVSLEVVPGAAGPAARRTFPLRETPAALQELWEPADGIDYRWSRVTATGVARTRAPEALLRLVAEIPVDDRVLEAVRRAGGDRAHVLLFSPSGYPVAGTVDLAAERAPEAAAARRAVADDLRRAPGEPGIRARDLGGLPHAVAYDLVRSSDGRTAGLLATALPRQPHLAATLGTRDLVLLLGSLAFVVAVVVADLVTRRVAGPVSDLARVARLVGEGDLRVRAGEEGRDEIASLAGAFNRMAGQLEGRISELSRLHATMGEFAGTLDRARALELALAAFRDAAPADAVLVVLADPEKGDPELAAGRRGEEVVAPRRLAAGGFLASALRRSPACAVPLPAETPEAREGPEEERALLAGAAEASILPFSAGRGRTEGAVVLLRSSPAPAASPDFLAALAHQAGLALENARLYRLAVEDPSSGLYAASYFKRRLQEEIDRSRDAGRPTSLVVAGLEGLEGVFDRMGPEAGNAVLRGAVDRIRTQVRRMHLLARSDRDAVAILLPETPRALAEETAALVRAAVEGAPYPADAAGREVRIGATPVVVTAPDDAGSAEFLENEAVRALEKARALRRGAPAAGARPSPAAPPGVDPAESERLGFRSAKSLALLDAVNRIAASDVPVLVLGETGAGKEVVADLVHAKSRRAAGPLVKVNCAALPAPLLEAELFGYERGAFTGAERRHAGRFEQAHGGTLFLDEVGEMPSALQVKLLRVLQDRRVERLGGSGPVEVDVRVVAATNRDLPGMVESGAFREDLYYRLNVLAVAVPPLRARREDIPPLASRFLAEAVARQGGGPDGFSPEALDFLFRHPFPGNVRELRNMVERAVVASRGPLVVPRDLSFGEDRSGLRLGRAAEAVREGDPGEGASAAPRRGFREPPRTREPVPADLPERAARLLALLRSRGTLTNRDWCEEARVSTRTGLRDFETLLERGLAKRSGKRRSASYRPG
jgi:diguanylate cyclase (GGDEF)-like protein